MITKDTLLKVYYRDNECCVFCGTGKFLENISHHCFYRSQYYKEDRDNEWNLVTICKNCHFCIHHKGNKEKDKTAKLLAYNRYAGKYKDKLSKILKEKMDQLFDNF